MTQITTQNALQISHLSKVYKNGFKALDDINLTVKKGEIFALLGENGAGKTTLISTICGLTTPTAGRVTVNGFDTLKEYRKTRALIGLVPQELHTQTFESVRDTVAFTRGLFGKKNNPALLEKILKDLTLWEKRDQKIMTLSGGMKRRLLIAKALIHEPQIIFLDEPTAGVDVALRKDMWRVVSSLRDAGVTIILTTHYIEEAEEMADRIGIIDKGKLRLVEEKKTLMQKLGKKQLILTLEAPLSSIPKTLARFNLALNEGKTDLIYTYDKQEKRTGMTNLLTALKKEKIIFKDLLTQQTSLEEIFVNLVK